MPELFDTWAGSTSKKEMSRYAYSELLRLVTDLYDSGDEWQQDGAKVPRATRRKVKGVTVNPHYQPVSA